MATPVLHEELLDTKNSAIIRDLLVKHGFSERDYCKLALSLGLSKETVNDIEKEHKEDATQCLLECLRSWLQQTDDVKSKGGPTIFAVKNALLQMGEDKVANGIHKEKHRACQIFSQYEKEIQDVLPQIALYLYAEGIIGRMVLHGSPTEDAKQLLDTVKESICLNHHNLDRLAHSLQTMKRTAALGTAISEQYGKEYTPVKYWIAYKGSGDVELHLSMSVIVQPLNAIMKSSNEAIREIQAMKNTPPIKDLNWFLSRWDPSLTTQLEGCKTNSDILELVWKKCSLSNIGMMEKIVNHFKIEGLKPIIEEYKTSIGKLFDDLPLRNYLHGSASKVTLLVERSIDDETFDVIKKLLRAYVAHFNAGIKLLVVKEGN